MLSRLSFLFKPDAPASPALAVESAVSRRTCEGLGAWSSSEPTNVAGSKSMSADEERPIMWTTGGSDWSEMGGERDEAMVLMVVRGSESHLLVDRVKKPVELEFESHRLAI